MKTIVAILFSFFSFSFFTQIITNEKVNLATLLIDYDTYTYEGGAFNTFTCTNCSNDTLPFVIEYESPGDFGFIKFLLPTNDVFFHGDIIWMGQGEIFIPTSFSLNYPFNESLENYSLNHPITYFDMDGSILTNTELINQANTALQQIQKTSILNLFSNHETQIGIYLYPPTVGMFDPSVAKWVVFLYSNIKSNSSLNIELSSNEVVFPNPCSNLINIPSNFTSQTISIFDVNGKKQQHDLDLINNTISTEKLDNGIYFIHFEESNLKTKFVKE